MIKLIEGALRMGWIYETIPVLRYIGARFRGCGATNLHGGVSERAKDPATRKQPRKCSWGHCMGYASWTPGLKAPRQLMRAEIIAPEQAETTSTH